MQAKTPWRGQAPRHRAIPYRRFSPPTGLDPAPVAVRADEHLAPASGTEKQSGIVHCSPRRGGLDDPRLPGNTALGAVRQCGSGRSLGRDRQVDVVRGCAGLPDHCDLTPTAERRHHTGAPRRHLLIGNIGSGGRQPQAPGRGTGTTQSSSAPIPQSQFTRAVRRITALSQSRLHSATLAARSCPSRGSGWCVHTTDRASRVAPIPLFACVPPPIPRRNRSVLSSLASQPMAAFPVLPAGRLPHYPFRGLLSVHQSCGPHAR